MKSKNGEHDGFKRWVTSLSREELLDAMAFTFRPDTNSRALSSSVKSHEYFLLCQMVELQPPPPTPVHPRATGYKSRSQKGARLDYFYREEEHLRWRKPRLFQFVEPQNESMYGRSRKRNATTTKRFSVIARRKVAPWGDVYSLGCTREQQDADANLIKGTRLGRLRRDGGYHVTACFGEKEIGGKRKSTTKSGGARSILKMLQVASRGHFFLQDSKTPTEVCYYAPWLQPTERWFSLGMYLASRFQMALWDSYEKAQSKQQQYTVGRLIRQGGDWQCYKESMIRDAILRAIRSGVADLLKEEKTSSKLNYLRDGMLWSMLIEGHQKEEFNLPKVNADAKGYWKCIASAWTQVELVQIHLPNGKFKNLISEKLEEELVAQMEQAMFVEEKLEKQQQTSKDTLTGGTSKKKKKKSKRKKSKGNNSASDNIISQTAPSLPAHLVVTPDTKGDDSTSVEGENPCTKYRFPPSSVTAQERNKNIVFVLGIVEDITEEVFSKVGLEATPKFDAPVTDTKTKTTTNKTSKADDSVRNVSHKENAVDTAKNPITKAVDKAKSTADKANDALDKANGDVVETSVVSSLSHSTKSFPSGLIQTSRSLDQELMTENNGNEFSLYTGGNESFQSSIYNPFAVGSDFSLNNIDDIGGYVDNWRFNNRFQSRERSILTNFFESQNEKPDNDEDDDDDERLMAASTAASIASSSYKDTSYAAESEELTVPAKVVTNQPPAHTEMGAIRESDDVTPKNLDEAEKNSYDIESVGNGEKTSSVSSSLDFSLEIKADSFDDDKHHGDSKAVVSISELGNESKDNDSGCRSPTLRAPSTPPPTLSPILVSLADLKKVKEFHFKSRTHLSGPGSLPPNSPGDQNGMVSSWSREDLRIESFRDDHQIKNKQRDRIKSMRGLEIPTYKSVTVKSLPKSTLLLKGDSGTLDPEMEFTMSLGRKEHENKDCAQSETAMDAGQREHQDWIEEGDNTSLIKDETTTIISGISHRVESEELAVVQEERNNFRDMCLTLGAEVAKLKVMLATQQAVAAAPIDYQDSSFGYSKMYGHGSFDPHGTQPFFHGMSNGLRAGPKSDAGFHRYGDHESLFSEDEIYDPGSINPQARIDSVQYMTSSQTIASHTVAESDVSIDFNSIKVPVGQISGTIPAFDSFHFNGLQSRLTKDILQFLEATNIKMKKLDGRRKLAVKRFSRLVKTVWPRAQVKLYGSYISGLCLPSSDLDFVVCLPAVHKKDLALAPGVLEGRNAINETSQKLLARELKGESWIDPRSIKVIERTAVPVIKVSTKDTRAKMIQLDISFDGPEHHGLDANRMVAQTLEELPLIRPLMLVLKQFLLHRGLLTAYTGGLSSYCLFLMLARYLQEQPPSMRDCGSLLMGFLDFYGNFFDPRAIGISVGSRRYFARANTSNTAGYEPTGQPIQNRWVPPHQQHQNRVVVNNLPPSSNSVVFRRRNSFSDTGSVDGTSRQRNRLSFAKPTTTSTTSGQTPRFVPINNNNSNDTINTPSTHPKETNFRSSNGNNQNFFTGYDRPSTFDPLFVEDPLSGTNNVGRNAFRINQVQRAFSDAHRALVASLDWDIQSAEGNGKYPLLKCLLGNQREDVLYGI